MSIKSNGLGSGRRSASQDISQEFYNFLADVEGLVKETAELTGDELAQTRGRIVERISAARKSIGELGDNLAQQGRRSATATNEYVHEQPWKVIGASAAAAFLLGLVLARRG
ncbi:ElaB/YgaM/YqjD family protein [Metapseudomonas furukawaii]